MKVTVNTQQNSVVSVNTRGTTDVVAVGIQGPPGASASTIHQLSDVDVTTLINGSVLVYKANTNKWTSTTTLDAQNVDAGEF